MASIYLIIALEPFLIPAAAVLLAAVALLRFTLPGRLRMFRRGAALVAAVCFLAPLVCRAFLFYYPQSQFKRVGAEIPLTEYQVPASQQQSSQQQQ